MVPHKVLAFSTAVMTLCLATPPPGYVKKPDNDKDPPKYEFGYDVRDGKGGRQGHLETRDGVYALGMYYVNLPDGSGQSVRYFADDWGYHPLVTYSSSTKSGSTKTHFALGEKAVAALAKSKDASPSIPIAGPTASAVTSPVHKLPANTPQVDSNVADILKIRPIHVKASPKASGSSGRKISASYQQTSRPKSKKVQEQVDVPSNYNIVDSTGSNAGSGNVEYEVVTPLHSTSHTSTGISTPSPATYITHEPSNYESGQGYQAIGTEGTGSSSYQLIEIGGDSSKGNSKDSESQAPVYLSSISESANSEAGKSSEYSSDGNIKGTIRVSHKNNVFNFGDRIPSVSTSSVSNVEQEQNEIQKEEKEIIHVTPTPAPQRYSPLRPIIVAEIYPKGEEKQTTASIRPIVVSPTTAPETIHISHSPQSLSSVSFSSSDGGTSSVDSSHGTSDFSTQGASLQYTSGSGSNSQHLTSIGKNGHENRIVALEYSTPKPIVATYSEDAATSQYSSGSQSDSTSYIEQGSTYDTQPVTEKTEAPVIFSYSQGSSYSSSGEGETSSQAVVASNNGNSGHVSNTQQSPAPIFLFYQPQTSYSETSGASVSSSDGTKVSNAAVGFYPTTVPIFISQSHELSSGSQESSHQQSVKTINNGNTGHVIDSQQSSPTTVYVTHSPHSTSFSVSDSAGKSQESNSVITTNVGTSGHVENKNIHSTTPSPVTISYSNSEDVSSRGYIVSSTPAPISLHSNSLPVAAALTSTAEILAPIQAGVSLGTVSHQKPFAVHTVNPVTKQPPQVTEEVDDIPQAKTVVEIQKSIAIDVNSLTSKPNDGTHKQNEVFATSAPLISYNQQIVESGKQVEQNSGQQQINTGNVLVYGYRQPLIGLHVQPQITHSPQLVETGQVLYDYNPQLFEAQKVTHSEHNTQQQLYGEVQQQSQYEQSQESFEVGKQQQQGHTEKQVDGQLYVTSGYQQQQVTEAEKEGEKYQYNQQLTGEAENNLQNHQQQIDVVKQQVTTAYNQQLTGGEHQVISPPLPEVTQVQAGYNQQLVQTENQVQKYEAPVKTNQDVKYQHHIQVIHHTGYQEPLQVSPQVTSQEPVQISQVISQKPIALNHQIQYLEPIKENHQQQEQNVNNEEVQSEYNQQIIYTPIRNQQNIQTNIQTSQSNSQIINKVQPTYNRNPAEVSKQLQSEYSHQLEEEQRQEQIRFNNQIGEALKQIHAEYTEDSSEKDVSTQNLQDEKTLVPVVVPIEYTQLDAPVQNFEPLAPVNTEQRPTKVVEVEKQVPIEHTKFITVEKPVNIHHTKVVEKPVPVPHAVPFEVTKLVAVDRPVPYPQPIAVPHPVPVPYAVPHPIGVPVPHLVPYPHVVTVPYKELHPVYIRNGKPHKHESAIYHYQVQNFPPDTPLPAILKALQYQGGRYGVPVSVKPHQYNSWRTHQSGYLTPPPLKSSGRGTGLHHSKYLDNLRTLCIEYGFKPPLVPSLQIDEIPASAYGPPKKD
ncbi:uncharacterized protein [Periplaneta americana]|uniref:uncharacterized protein n=1 Tax=Periplaneta americana TaxID=6978 RepID=UPI0037E82010